MTQGIVKHTGGTPGTGENRHKEKKQLKRSVLDRRSSLARRVINLGPKYLDQEQRKKRERRIRWEDRIGWDPLHQWTHFSMTSKVP